MNYLQDAIAEIEAQQAKLKEWDHARYMGEQVKDILRDAPAAAEIVLQDLKAEGMKLKDCEKKIAEYAREHGGNCPGDVADRIIREFYGIPARRAEPQRPAESRQTKRINFADLLPR